MSVDLTLDAGEEIRFLNKIGDTVKHLLKRTHFNARELEVVLLIYYKLLRDEIVPGAARRQEQVSRHQLTIVFDTVFGLKDNIMLGRIFAALDKGVTSCITMETWAITLSLFLRGTFEEKIKYCFRVYDIAGERVIRRDHMMILLRSAFIKHQEEEVEEAVKDMVDIIIHRMDIDRDGAISFEDYRETVRKTPGLLECFGQALPDRSRIYSFSKTFLDRVRKF
ncbi:calaxin-like [Uranotaenia lowii]|uniref:calaxin-like n=1 Tax=Uranotaenia lowii TaxID=190385 RepID=UPI002479AB01|nr:calaxin-like [Uranotaenia lowii]